MSVVVTAAIAGEPNVIPHLIGAASIHQWFKSWVAETRRSTLGSTDHR